MEDRQSLTDLPIPNRCQPARVGRLRVVLEIAANCLNEQDVSKTSNNFLAPGSRLAQGRPPRRANRAGPQEVLVNVRMCHAAGGELEQIQFLLGHVSIQTTERYLGCKQRIRAAVNGRIGIEPED
jgi:hypothetical protein